MPVSELTSYLFVGGPEDGRFIPVERPGPIVDVEGVMYERRCVESDDDELTVYAMPRFTGSRLLCVLALGYGRRR